MHDVPTVALLGLVVAATCACSANPQRDDAEKRAQFRAYAGPPLDRFVYLQHYTGWKRLGNGQVVLWTTINDAYLMTITLPCVGLDFVTNLRLTSTQNMVTSGIDSVIVQGQACRISEIRHVDYERMKRELHVIP